MSTLHKSPRLYGPQEVTRLILARDWSSTSLGPLSSWSDHLISTLNMILNTNNPVFVFWGDEYRCFYNDGYIPILGKGKHPGVLGACGKDAWPEIWDEYTFPEIQKSRSGKSTWNVDQFIPVYRDGETAEGYFTYGYSPIYDVTGAIAGVLVVANETSDKVFANKRAQTALAINDIQKKSFELAIKDAPLSETLKLLTSLVEAQTTKKSHASVLVVDSSGKHLLTGAAPTLPPVYNQAVHGLVIGEGAGSCGTAAARKTPVIVEDIRTSELWKPYWDFVSQFSFRACWSTPILSSRGEVLGTFALYHDEYYSPTGLDEEIVRIATQTAGLLIERDRAQILRKETEEDLRLAVYARDEFLSIASHELKTPLTALKLDSQIQLRFAERDKKTDDIKKYGKFVKLVMRLDRLVEDMLDISRIQTGRLTVRKEKTNLPEMIRELIERTPSEASITFLSPPEVTAMIDVLRFEQVLTNIFQNARKYAPGSPVEVTLSTQGGLIELRIHDEGPGISPEAQKKIFERFERAISASEVSGLGLGLYISREIIHAHGGSISVESTPGKGATFIIQLPQ